MALVRSNWPKSTIKSLAGRYEDAELQCQNCESGLAEAIRVHPKIEKGIYVGNLGGLSKFSGLQARVLLTAKASEEGWTRLAYSLECCLASLRVLAGMSFLRCTLSATSDACAIFCTSLLLNSRNVQDWTAELIVNSHSGAKGLTDISYSPFSMLAVQLANQYLGIALKNVPKSQELPGFYDQLLAAETIDAAQKAIDDLAIERVRLVQETHIDYPPFEYSPFDLFPVDLMAIAKVRFPNHSFTYGVLESPLCHPPIPFPFQSDPLVERVLARCRELMPIPEVTWG